MRKLNQSGSAVLILIVVLVLAAVAGAGYMVYSRRNDSKTSTTQDSTGSNKSSTSNNTASDSVYIDIMDWGVKIGLGKYADKVTVSSPSAFGTNNEKSQVKVTVKSDFSVYTDCETTFSIVQLKDVSGFDKAPKDKVGDYYYYNSGISECDGATESGKTDVVSIADLQREFEANGVKAL